MPLGTVAGVHAPGSLLWFIFVFVENEKPPEGGTPTGLGPSGCLHMTNLAKVPFKLIYCFTAFYKSGPCV